MTWNTLRLWTVSLLLVVSVQSSRACPAECACDVSTVNCSARGLLVVPADIPTNTTILLLDHNAIVTVDDTSLSLLVSLTELDLSYNFISNLSSTCFSSQTKLEELSLEHNLLTALPPGVFNNLTHVREIELASNALTSLPAHVFDQCQLLADLDLSNNVLDETVYRALENAFWILTIDLSLNKLNLLPYLAFKNHDMMSTLRLDNSGITYMDPNALLGLTDLDHLYLADNNLTSLNRETFEPITSHITTLDVSGNPLLCDCDLKKFQDWLVTVTNPQFPAASCYDVITGKDIDVETGNLSHLCTDLGLPTYPSDCAPNDHICAHDASIYLYVTDVDETSATLVWEASGFATWAEMTVACRQFMDEPFLTETVPISDETLPLTGLQKATLYTCCVSVHGCDVSGCSDFETPGKTDHCSQTILITIICIVSLLLVLSLLVIVLLMVLRHRTTHSVVTEKSAELLRHQQNVTSAASSSGRVTMVSMSSTQSRLSNDTNIGRPLPQPNRESLYDYIAESELVNMAPTESASAPGSGCTNTAFSDSDSSSTGGLSAHPPGTAPPQRYIKDHAASDVKSKKKKKRLFLSKLDTTKPVVPPSQSASGATVDDPASHLSSQYLTTPNDSMPRKPRRFVRSRDAVSAAQSPMHSHKPVSLPVSPSHSDDELSAAPPREHSRSDGDIRINRHVLTLQPQSPLSGSNMTSPGPVAAAAAAAAETEGNMSRSISQDIVPYLPPKKLSADSSSLDLRCYQQILDDAEVTV